jgi:hypothetical protein
MGTEWGTAKMPMDLYERGRFAPSANVHVLVKRSR